jgi:rhodanese-related sulfurtransferase
MKSISVFFKKTESISVDDARQFMRQKDPGEYNLIDVRQPKEYTEKHIPGAQLIPVGQIDNQAQKIDSTKPTLVY